MPFDASTPMRVKRTSFGQKAKARNFRSEGASHSGKGTSHLGKGTSHGGGASHGIGASHSIGASGRSTSRSAGRTGERLTGHTSGHTSKDAPKGGREVALLRARREGKAGENTKPVRVPRRKEITPKRVSHKPGFTTFQLRLVNSILTTTLVDGKPLDKAYALWFAKVKLPQSEQGFVINHINAMFRRLSYYAQLAGLKRPSDFKRHVNFLILAYYAEMGWPEPELDAEGFDRSGLTKRQKAAQEHPLLVEGCPYWLEELGSRELKEAWPAERKALGEPAKRFIRTNTLKTTRDELASRLTQEGVVTRSVKGVNTALEVTSNSALFRTTAFREGLFEQQDPGSQEIAPFLQVEPGMRVIDACAGAGGKTLHLAALMQNKGTLIALDIEQWKLDDLRKRASRAGVFNVEVRLIDSTKVVKRLYEHADRVLIDAPCSGLGVLRRTADSKWADINPRLVELKKVQADILERYSHMVKVGGKVVYSTCSILPSENQAQVQAFLEKHPDSFKLEEEKVILPSSGFDGFYMARLVRLA